MAKQKGLIKLKGTIGDITFYKSKDGFIAREKTSIDSQRIATDPAFQRTRENGAEFGRAGKGGKLLRSSIRTFLKKASDGRVVSRITKKMMEIVKSDPVNVRGERKVSAGMLSLLTGFEFNLNAKLEATLFAPFTHSINRQTGECKISIPGFSPMEMLGAPAGTTHFNIFSVATVLDFDTEQTDQSWEETAPLPYSQASTGLIELPTQLPANSTMVIALLLGIEFFQEVNGNMYSLKNGAFNAMAIVGVDQA